MRRAAGVALFLAATGVSVYAFHLLAYAMSLSNNAAGRYSQEGLLWHLRWVLLAFLLTGGFLVIVQGRWRFAAAIPLAITGLVAYSTLMYAFA